MIILTIAGLSRIDLPLVAQANASIHADSADPEPLASTALPLTIVHAFAGGADLAYPHFPLVQGQDGLFYGIAGNSVFRVTADGDVTSLHTFSGPDGSEPNELLQVSDGTWFGTTDRGGANDEGVAFAMDSSGAVTVLHHFAGSEGGGPSGPLVVGSDGQLYGTAIYGGDFNEGVVFRMTRDGTVTVLHSFQDLIDGQYPSTGVVLGRDGNFYGTTAGVEDSVQPNIFRMTPAGTLTVLFTWKQIGVIPSGLIQATNGSFYGSHLNGAFNNTGAVFGITPSGDISILHSFGPWDSSNSDGIYPNAVMQASDGNLYGTTSLGGVTGNGGLFQLSLKGTFRVLHPFKSDGVDPSDSEWRLTEAANGDLYGTGALGGPFGLGMVFRLRAPDLQITSLKFPPIGGAGLPLIGPTTIQNLEMGTAAPSTSRFYLSTDPALTSTDVAIGAAAIPEVVGLSSVTQTVSVTIPAGTPTGKYYVIEKADADGDVIETKEGNNTKWNIVYVGPDLVISGITAPASSTAGSSMTVKVTTKNTGGGDTAAPSETRLYLSTDAVVDPGDALLTTITVPDLGPGQAYAITRSITLPSSAMAGTYYLIAIADANATISEIHETNNSKAKPFTIH
jgi:uncharacterized repeat protein (TIGR03803 family)